MKAIKVRFNLGKGPNYMKFKVEYPDGRKEYYHPSDYQLVMSDCILKNHKKTAQKIFDGAEKTVCAWILCKQIEIRNSSFIKDDTRRVRYNPRVQPNWLLDGQIVDNKEFEKIHSIDWGLYLTK